MKSEQYSWRQESGWSPALPSRRESEQLVLLFGGGAALQDDAAMATLRAAFPKAELVGCSTAGEIFGTRVYDDTLVATAISFDSTRVAVHRQELANGEASRSAGAKLGDAIEPDGLAHVFVLSDGLLVNGSELVAGLVSELPAGVAVTGGLSADGPRFEQTFVLDERGARSGTVTAVAFYGQRLEVGYASLGGWDTFGPERVVTRSTGNVLFELDGKDALQLYRDYLGPEAAEGLPATGLLFPLALRRRSSDERVVRTILAVDDAACSMTFAGDIPEGSYAQLMRANFDRLVEGAGGAARATRTEFSGTSPDLAILISCVGRKMVLKQRVEEEVEAVRDVLGPEAVMTGFYSYGEISPFVSGAPCALHNQTMTVTTLSER